MKASDFFTLEVANTGRRVMIPGRDGRLTAEWLHIHHTDSDSFRQKKADSYRAAAMRDPNLTDAERTKLFETAMLGLLVSTVSGWSLEDEFSRENVMALLANAPYLADWLDRTTSDASVFFGNGSTGSLSTAEPKQDLSSLQKAEPDDSATT